MFQPPPAARAVAVEVVASDGEHVVALRLGPIEEECAQVAIVGVGWIIPVVGEEAVPDMEATQEHVVAPLVAEPQRIGLVPREHPGEGGGHAVEGAADPRGAVGEGCVVAPNAKLVWHETDLPDVAAIVEAPEGGGALVGTSIGDIQCHVVVWIRIAVGIGHGRLEAVPDPHRDICRIHQYGDLVAGLQRVIVGGQAQDVDADCGEARRGILGARVHEGDRARAADLAPG